MPFSGPTGGSVSLYHLWKQRVPEEQREQPSALGVSDPILCSPLPAGGSAGRAAPRAPAPKEVRGEGQLKFGEDKEFYDISGRVSSTFNSCVSGSFGGQDRPARAALFAPKKTRNVETGSRLLTTVTTDNRALPANTAVALQSFKIDDAHALEYDEDGGSVHSCQSQGDHPEPSHIHNEFASFAMFDTLHAVHEASPHDFSALSMPANPSQPQQGRPGAVFGGGGGKKRRIAAQRTRVFLPPQEELLAVDKHCDDLQKKALSEVVAQAKKLHEEALPKLREKVTRMRLDEKKGKKEECFTEEHLNKALLWIRDEAPIIIHIPFEADGRMEKLLADTHFRNQFETKISRGTLDYEKDGSRASWESRLFNNHYNEAEPFQRPKYGCLNIVNDPRGIKCATCYGESYIILKGCRLRTTFADRDSSCHNTVVASCEYHAHVLATYNDKELRRVLEVGNRMALWHQSDCIDTYKEVQIHGEISLADNVDIVVVAENLGSATDMMGKVQKFCEKNNCHYVVSGSSGDFKGDLWSAAKGTAPAVKPSGFLLKDPYAKLPSFIVDEGDLTPPTAPEASPVTGGASASSVVPPPSHAKPAVLGLTSESFCMDEFFAYDGGEVAVSTKAKPDRHSDPGPILFRDSASTMGFDLFGSDSGAGGDAPKPTSAKPPGLTSTSFCMDDFFAYDGGDAAPPAKAKPDRRSYSGAILFRDSSSALGFDLFGSDSSAGGGDGAPKPTSAKPPGLTSTSFCMDDFFAYDGGDAAPPAKAKPDRRSDSGAILFRDSSSALGFDLFGSDSSVGGGVTAPKPASSKLPGFTSTSFCMDDFFAFDPADATAAAAHARGSSGPTPCVPRIGFSSGSFCMEAFFAYDHPEGDAAPVASPGPLFEGPEYDEADSSSSSFSCGDLFGGDGSSDGDEPAAAEAPRPATPEVPHDKATQWVCRGCTYINPRTQKQCGMCAAEDPVVAAAHERMLMALRVSRHRHDLVRALAPLDSLNLLCVDREVGAESVASGSPGKAAQLFGGPDGSGVVDKLAGLSQALDVLQACLDKGGIAESVLQQEVLRFQELAERAAGMHKAAAGQLSKLVSNNVRVSTGL